jgi:hypothetical protein
MVVGDRKWRMSSDEPGWDALFYRTARSRLRGNSGRLLEVHSSLWDSPATEHLAAGNALKNAKAEAETGQK